MPKRYHLTRKLEVHQARKRTVLVPWTDSLQVPSSSGAVDSHVADGSSMTPEDISEPEPSRYDIRRDKEEAGWLGLSRELENGFASYFSHLSPACSICGKTTEVFRCEKCHLLEVCDNCLKTAHSHNPPHVVRKWTGHRFETIIAPVRLSRRKLCTCSIVTVQPVTAVNEEGEDIPLTVEECACISFVDNLLSHGFWPTKPFSDNSREVVAIHFNVILALDSISSRCTASLSSLCSAMRHTKSSIWLGSPTRINLFRALNTSGSFRAFRRMLQQIRWDKYASCPSCYTEPLTVSAPVAAVTAKSTSVEMLEAPTFLMLDACFGFRHRSLAGKASPPPASGFFVDVDLGTPQEPSESHCPNWKAGGRGQDLATASDRRKLDVFGLFCGSCRHSSVVYLADVTTPGERLAYSKAMVTKALEKAHPDQKLVVSYDIGCKLAGHFSDPRVSFVIPAFHAYGHQEACQTKFGIRNKTGVGLTDGESCERLWSMSRRFGPQLKEMTHVNRREFLNNWANSVNFDVIITISSWLHHRSKVETKSLHRFQSEVRRFCLAAGMTCDTSEFLAICRTWQQELSNLSLKDDTIKLTRRSPTEDVRFKLQQLASERAFLIRHAAAETGQKLNRLLNRTLSKLTAKAQALVRQHNASSPPNAAIDLASIWSNSLEGSHPDYAQKRQAVKLLQLHLRISEEAALVRKEVRRASFFFANALLRTRTELDCQVGGPKTTLLHLRASGIEQLIRRHAAMFSSEKVIFTSLLSLQLSTETSRSQPEESSDEDSINTTDEDDEEDV